MASCSRWRTGSSERTWTLCKLPAGKKAIKNKWVFKIKRNENRIEERYKARLVVKECSQHKGYDETYARVACLTILRTLLNLINEEDLNTRQLDVKNTFLHGKLNDEIYMEIPKGVKNKEGLVCKLNESLYKLKQAIFEPRSLFKTFVE